jgi:hypothetical protein
MAHGSWSKQSADGNLDQIARLRAHFHFKNERSASAGAGFTGDPLEAMVRQSFGEAD